jgi:hypothetical protein
MIEGDNMELLQEKQDQGIPESIDDIISGLKGFGLEDCEEILTIKASGREHVLRISNIPSEDEMMSLLAVEDSKGYAWVQRVKIEILSRALSYIDGIKIRDLSPAQRMVKDPTDKSSVKKDIQVVLRNILSGWGQEITNILWKVLMVHSQKIEDRLIASFPESSVMTDVERRFFDQAMKEIEEVNKAVIAEEVTNLFKVDGEEVVKQVEKDLNEKS